MIVSSDIDIDMADRDSVLEGLLHRAASIMRDGAFVKHNSGVYFQDIPTDPHNNQATFDHKEAEKLGYFKVDFLNNHIYDDIKTEQELDELLSMEPCWELLEHEEIVEQLAHVGNYHYLLKRFKPKSIEELAMILAIIRPAKKHLQDKNWNIVKEHVWTEEGEGYRFKKGHAISYAAAIVVQLNKIVKKGSK